MQTLRLSQIASERQFILRIAQGEKMSSLSRCENCKGRKRVMGMGAMMKECPECKGIGWIAEEQKDIPVKIRKKRQARIPALHVEENGLTGL